MPIMQCRIDILLHLEEEHQDSQKKFHEHQQVVESWFDKILAGKKEFDIGDLVLKWVKPNEPKGKHRKFQKIWLGPNQIDQKLGSSTFKLITLN
jgi:hypothetical protein